MMYEKPNFIVEVKATDSKDFVFLRITILDHKSKDSIADDIHNMYLDIYEAFNEVYGNSSNLNTAMEVFTDRSEVVMIDDTSFPVIDQRVFAVSEILNEADLKKTFFLFDMFGPSNGKGHITESTLIYLEAFETIREYVRYGCPSVSTD